MMRSSSLTVKKILRKLEQREHLTHNEEFFFLVEVLNFSEDRVKQILMFGSYEVKKLKPRSAR
jgi:hypothetical protein